MSAGSLERWLDSIGMAVSAHLARAYRCSRYTVCGHAVIIGRRAAPLDAMLAALGEREGVLITAWNPRSRKTPRLRNVRMMSALMERVRGCQTLPARSFWRGWDEEMILLAGDARRAAKLGRRFGQAAVVLLRRGQEARLIYL